MLLQSRFYTNIHIITTIQLDVYKQRKYRKSGSPMNMWQSLWHFLCNWTLIAKNVFFHVKAMIFHY